MARLSDWMGGMAGLAPLRSATGSYSCQKVHFGEPDQLGVTPEKWANYTKMEGSNSYCCV